jgi:hypothetical protein
LPWQRSPDSVWGEQIRRILFLSLALRTIIGTVFIASGAGALNQYVERQFDAQMRRTARRPLAAGRLNPSVGFVFGITMAVIGDPVLEGRPFDLILYLAIPENAFKSDELALLEGLGEFREISPGEDAVPFGAGTFRTAVERDRWPIHRVSWQGLRALLTFIKLCVNSLQVSV